MPNEALQAYNLMELHFGKNYIIPQPFGPRLIEHISPRIVQAAKRQKKFDALYQAIEAWQDLGQEIPNSANERNMESSSDQLSL